MKFDLEREKVINKIKTILKTKKNPKIIFQAPEGLKLDVEKEAEEIGELLDIDIFIYGNSCFGACDIPNIEYDLLVHYGHEPLPYIEYNNVLFIPAYQIFSREEEQRIKKDIYEFIKVNDNVEIATTVQYKKILKEFNPKIVLGCRANLENRKNILFVGTGRFHPLLLSYKYKKDIFIYNPISYKFDKIETEESKKFIKKRISIVSKLFLNPPKKVGIVISTKPGQRRIKKFNEIKNLLRDSNINYILIEMNDISPEYLYYNVDCYIIVACPRIVLDDYIRYNKPIYTVEEFKMFLNNNFDYKLDEIQEEDF